MSLLSEDLCTTFKKEAGKHSHGATNVLSNTNLISCKAKCLQLATNCTAFEFNRFSKSCWVHDNKENIVELFDDLDVDQYVKTNSSCACKL